MPTIHVTSKDELNARLRQDPHDPVAILLVEKIRRLMHERGLTREEAFAAFFEDNERLNETIATPAVYKNEKLQELHSLIGGMAFLVLVVGSFLAVIYNHEARVPLIRLMGALFAILTGFFVGGLKLGRAIERYSVFVAFAIATCSYFAFRFLLAVVVRIVFGG